FARRPDGHFEGLVTRMRPGPNVLTVSLPDGRGARLVITDHPNGGPVFSGPQIKPWKCQQTAKTRLCDERPKYTYLYKSSDPWRTGSQPYAPSSPPGDVATTPTDTGATVPFIVRIETGYQDRDRYRIEVLFRPGKRWSRWAPQRGWNHKVLIMHGGSCHT